MKSKKPILKKILIVFVSFIGIIGLLIGGFFLKSNIFSNNYSGKTLEKHLEVETDGNETPLKAIGVILGGEDHAYISHGVKKIEADLKIDEALNNTVNTIRKKINPL